MYPSFRRAATGFFVMCGVILGAVPLLATLSLARGGDGLGVCPDGAWLCSSPYMPIARLAGGVLVGLLVVTACIRLIHKVSN